MIDRNKLIFDERSHTYRLDGQTLISVTQVLKPISELEYEEIREDVLENASKRGTAIHFALELYNEFGVEEIDEEYRGYLEAYKSFLRTYHYQPIHNERQVVSELGYAGTVDCVAKVNGIVTVVDYKTTSKLNPRKVGLQLAAYRQALKEEGIDTELGAVLQLKKDGKYKFLMYDSNQLDEHFKYFKLLLDAQKVIKYYALGESILTEGEMLSERKKHEFYYGD